MSWVQALVLKVEGQGHLRGLPNVSAVSPQYHMVPTSLIRLQEKVVSTYFLSMFLQFSEASNIPILYNALKYDGLQIKSSLELWR